MAIAEFRIVDENGDEIISAATVRTCANMQGISARRQADEDCASMNSAGDGKFVVQRVMESSVPYVDISHVTDADGVTRRLSRATRVF